MSDKETAVVVGTVNGIGAQGDKWKAEVTPDGAQYPKTLWSKSTELYETVVGLVGKVATFECGVSHWEREGKPMTSLWINSVQEGVHAETSLPTTNTGAGGGTAHPGVVTPVDPDPTRVSIERQTAVKAAVEFAPLLPEKSRSADDMLRLAMRIAAFLETGNPDADLPF